MPFRLKFILNLTVYQLQFHIFHELCELVQYNGFDRCNIVWIFNHITNEWFEDRGLKLRSHLHSFVFYKHMTNMRIKSFDGQILQCRYRF